MDGWLDLSGLTTVEGLKLPKHVGAGLDLRGLTTAEGLEFPEDMGGWLDLSGPDQVAGAEAAQACEWRHLLLVPTQI